MTSILHTYYSWKIYRSEDVSYNIVIVCFWATAEIAMGIIVSCLPVLPRFFQHYGPKIRRYGPSLNTRSRSLSNTMKPNLTSKVLSPLTKLARPVGFSNGWTNSSVLETQPSGDFVDLVEYHVRPGVTTRDYPHHEHSYEGRITTNRGNLEGCYEHS